MKVGAVTVWWETSSYRHCHHFWCVGRRWSSAKCWSCCAVLIMMEIFKSDFHDCYWLQAL